jgi:MoxR-like ATPase
MRNKSLTPVQARAVEAVRQHYRLGPSEPFTLTRAEILAAISKAGLNEPQWWLNHSTYRAERGVYSVPSLTSMSGGSSAKAATKAAKASSAPAPTVEAPKASTLPEASLAFHTGSLVPEKMATYVPFGCHRDISTIVKSRKFLPVYVTGLSGNGKTTTFEQVCAEQGREFFRVNITPETGEDDLLGGLRLINGETVWVDGPVVTAMKRGAFLLLDEVDLGTTKVMCLQPVLEGKGVFLKKTNTWVYPKEGFTVGLTGNTKGRGDESGKFVGTNIMNEAFLDRVPLTIEQEYPKPEVEEKIVIKIMNQNGETSEEFAKLLVRWADQNRKAYGEGAIEDVITTRRLVQAATLYAVFGDRIKAVEGILTRFDAQTRQSLLELYKKLDATSDGGLNTEPLGEAPTTATPTSNAVPF